MQGSLRQDETFRVVPPDKLTSSDYFRDSGDRVPYHSTSQGGNSPTLPQGLRGPKNNDILDKSWYHVVNLSLCAKLHPHCMLLRATNGPVVDPLQRHSMR